VGISSGVWALLVSAAPACAFSAFREELVDDIHPFGHFAEGNEAHPVQALITQHLRRRVFGTIFLTSG